MLSLIVFLTHPEFLSVSTLSGFSLQSHIRALEMLGRVLPAFFTTFAVAAYPPIPGNLPFFSPVSFDGAPGFTAANSLRFKNRALYGTWNGGLVLSGDLPITHLADDTRIFGGLLIGVSSGNNAAWLHTFAEINSTFAGGAMRWTGRDDARFPGLVLSAAVYAASDGVGFVLDANVTTGSPADLIWAWGCGTLASGGAVGWQKDPLVNPSTLQWDFSPRDCYGNNVTVGADNSTVVTTFSGGSVGLSVATSSPTRSIDTARASDWNNASALLHGISIAASSTLPVPGASLWLQAASLVATVSDGGAVSAWADESGAGADIFSQVNATLRPTFLSRGFGSGQPAVRFDGSTFLTSFTPTLGSESTMFAVLRDDGSETNCCSGALFFNGSNHGISTLIAPGTTDDDDGAHEGPAIVTTLDYPGSAAYGHTNIRNRSVVASAVYSSSGPSFSMVDACVQGSATISGVPSTGGAIIGRRGYDVPRFFKGVIGEIVVFPRVLNSSELDLMQAYFFASWPALVPKKSCSHSGLLAVGRSALFAHNVSSVTRFTFAAVGDAAPVADPLSSLSTAQSRALRLATRATSNTPSALVDAALPAMSLAVDGLYREKPGAFVHGAMAWDSLYLGWRSEYGATVFGAPELVSNEGRYFVGKQTVGSTNTKCHSDPALLLTAEASDSRFHGNGRIDANGNIYDMQSQFFDQQIHMWRWTGNTTHESILRPALKLHVEWANDCFDADGNGLYSSYTNTWPTDSQFYSGGETYEETVYMYRAHLALSDMATRAGNASEAAAFAAMAGRIRAAAQELWVTDLGLPASHREEGGHRRLRPDPWLYSVFVPIEAQTFWDAATAAQALFFTEYGLERNSVPCSSDAASLACGEVVWTSNWVPSMWSVRQMWSGDNSGLALAYFLTGLPDDGFAVLNGTLHKDMLQSAVPGQSGGANGGTDFNDCVHPLSRALVEGFFGFRPDYVAGAVVVAPQFPSSWTNASFSSADVSLQFTADLSTSTSLAVTLARPAPALILRIPLRAGTLSSLSVTGVPPGASVTNFTEAGFGQTVVVVRVTAAPSGTLVTGAAVSLAFTAALPCAPSVHADAEAGAAVTLTAPVGLSLVNFSDPQGVLSSGARVVGGSVVGAVAPTVTGHHLVLGSAVTDAGGLPQTILFKLNVSAAGPAPPPPARPARRDSAHVELRPTRPRSKRRPARHFQERDVR